MSEKQKYDPKSVEAKWQKYWQDHKLFKSDHRSTKPKSYILDMFPYPSGAGLHVGHLQGYTATDVLARYKRMKGFNVLHPMGWDNFGLPAEQYAIRTGTHPAITTKKNIDNFRRQLQSLGYSYDWEREVTTSDPDYYKWTQWIFTKLHERGLAYEAEVSVNFCPELGTVLANEEVENGRAKEGGFPVIKKPLRQWMLRITAYAERLIQDLDLLDWPDSLKQMQVNWIGQSTGAYVTFKELKNGVEIPVFTTRPDTLFGATYLVLAPEHPLVDKIVIPSEKEKVAAYQKMAAAETEQERMDATRVKTGIFTGAYALNPVNQKQIPIWVADYVLAGYGTGAIMAVPAHDSRDFEFAQAFHLPIAPVLQPDVVASADLLPTDLTSEQVTQQVLEGKRCWPGEGILINSAHDKLSLNGQSKKEAIATIISWLESSGQGKGAVVYKLRDWLFSRQRYWGEPFPILHFEDGSKRLLEVDELPLCPPTVQDYKPSAEGQSPLAKVKDWVEITDPKTSQQARRETNTMPQWAGSCWYYLRFCDPLNNQAAWGKDEEAYWMPVDLYVGGVEHAVLHLLYARFWHKVLYDCGYVSTPEPFKTLRNQGLILGRSFQRSNGRYVSPDEAVERDGKWVHRESGEELRTQIEKMSKSKLNGVSPDELIEEFGADSVRLYEMFMGPLDKDKLWNTDAISGCRRFLNRFYDLCFSSKVSEETTPEALKLGHRLVYGVEKDLESLQFNTAIAKHMEFINAFSQLESYPKPVLKMAILALAPLAPHIAEEMWEQLGGSEALAHAAWPEADPDFLQDESVTLVVQVNGKLRASLVLPRDQAEEQVLEAAKANSSVRKLIEGKTVRKVVFVPNRLINLVVS